MTSFRTIDVSGATPVAPSDQPSPMLDWVPINRLVIDDLFQRPLTARGWAVIRKIAAEFDWSCFSPVMLAPIEGGLFSIIDGQHRTHAAAICGFDRVPAMITHMAMTKQANAFAKVNGAVTPVSSHQLFKAALAAGEHWAERADLAVMAAGCKLMTYHPSSKNKKVGEIYCVGLIKRMILAGHSKVITAVLAAIHNYADNGRVGLYSDYILAPLMAAAAMRDEYLDLDLVAFLKRNDPYKVLSIVEQMRGGDAAFAGASAKRDAFVRLLDQQIMRQAA